jgi:hypothetical protein
MGKKGRKKCLPQERAATKWTQIFMLDDFVLCVIHGALSAAAAGWDNTTNSTSLTSSLFCARKNFPVDEFDE